jgi:NarL family two-component system response regulator LiaR
MGEPMGEPITVLIVDDHAVVRQGVRTFLAAQPDIAIAGDVGSGEEAIQMAAESAPDVALMDLVMAGMDGVEATRRLKRVSPRTQIIVLTSYHQDEHIFPAIRAGALSYLLKDVLPSDLAQAVRKAASGEAVLHPQVAARVVQEVQGAALSPVNPFTDLTSRELEVLRLVAEGLANEAIASRLVISEKTVKCHVSNILGKLHVADRTQAAVYAWREGILRQRGESIPPHQC